MQLQQPPGYTLPGLQRRTQASSPLRAIFTGGSFRKPKALNLHFGLKRDISGRESRMVTFGGTKAAVPLGPLASAKRGGVYAPINHETICSTRRYHSLGSDGVVIPSQGARYL